VDGKPASLPSGVRLYVIGDIHGRLDLLRPLEAMILDDIAASGAFLSNFVIYLGDYVDRGFESRQVIDHLLAEPLEGCRRVLLLGNHDAWLRDFVKGEPVGSAWLVHGGDATLLSYGVRLDLQVEEQERLQRARINLAERMTAAHLRFLEDLELAFSMGDYFFCHAGIRPGVPLDRQSETDLVWIREPFLGWSGDAGKIVVHGHTPVDRPVVRCNRISIDTGACWTGNLTSLVLEGTDYRFLSTGTRAGSAL
jgi:serine/threonine protein phosphatase 1